MIPPFATSMALLAATLVQGGTGDPPSPVLIAPVVVLTLTSIDPLPNCLTADNLKTSVERRLGRAVFADKIDERPGASALVIDVGLKRWRGPTWDVALNIARSDEKVGQTVVGRRNLRLKADACEDLLAPLVLIVTLTIDPNAPQPREPDATDDRPLAAPEKSVGAPENPGVVIATRPTTNWEFSLGAGLGAAWGLVPKLSATGHLRFMVSRNGWPSFALNAAYQRSSTDFHDTPSMREANVSFSATQIGLELLPRIWRQIHLVAALSCQTVVASGAGFDRANTAQNRGCSVGAGTLALAPIGARTSFFLRTEAALPLQRTRYNFGNSAGTTEEGYRSSPILLSLVTGLMLSF